MCIIVEQCSEYNLNFKYDKNYLINMMTYYKIVLNMLHSFPVSQNI